MKRINLLPLFLFGFAFLFFPFRLIQTLSVFLLLLYGIPFLLSRYYCRSVRVVREATVLYCPNGSAGDLNFTVENRGLLPVENIVITDKATGCYGEGTGLFLDSLPGRSRKTYSCALLTGVRGKYEAGPVTVKGADPFRFFPWEKTFSSRTNVVVYPASHPLKLMLEEGDRGGTVGSANLLYEDQTDLKGIRDYRPGDSPKRINWKASARTGSLQTMEFSFNLHAPLLILLDLTVSRYPLKHRHILMERAIEAAASLIESYGEAGQRLSLLTTGCEEDIFIPPGRGYGHIISILEELAQVSFSQSGAVRSPIVSLFEKGIKTESGTHIYLLAPSIHSCPPEEMALLRRNRSSVNLISTGGRTVSPAPAWCRQFTLSEYGREYFHDR